MKTQFQGINGNKPAHLNGCQHFPRVLLWSDSDQFAGTEKHICELEYGLRKRGIVVFVACPHPSDLSQRISGNGGVVVPANRSGLALIRAVNDVVRMLRSGRIDLVHVHNGRTAVLGACACALARRGKLVVSQHFIHPARLRRGKVLGWAAGFVHRWIGRRAAAWVAVSQAVRREMLSRMDSGGRPVDVVLNGVGGSELMTDAELVDEKGALVRRGGAPVLVCVARLAQEKGHETLLYSLSILKREGSEFTVWIVGDGERRGALEDLVRDLGLSGCVVFVGHQKESERWIDAGDALVLPSPEEPFGLVLLEAMCRQKPVVAARAGGPMEIVESENSGLLFEPGDARDLAAKLKVLLDHDVVRRKMGAVGFRRWVQMFSLEKMSADTVGVYQRVMAG